jgi:hypothetical protein
MDIPVYDPLDLYGAPLASLSSTIDSPWEFLKDFPDAASLAKAEAEIRGQSTGLREAQDALARDLVVAKDDMDRFQKSMASFRNFNNLYGMIDNDLIIESIGLHVKIALEERLTTAEDKLGKANAKVKALSDVCSGLQRVANPEMSAECTICLKNKVCYVHVPCGHCTCAECFRGRRLCHYCRADIEQTIKLYIS